MITLAAASPDVPLGPPNGNGAAKAPPPKGPAAPGPSASDPALTTSISAPPSWAPPQGEQKSAAGTAAKPAAASLEGSAFLGQVVWLLSQSPNHKHLFLTDLDWAVVPPVALKQFHLWKRNDVPVAYACWAFLNDAAAERLRSGVRKLAPQEWKCGDQLWLIDVVAPFGGMEAALKELRETVFKGKRIKTLQPAPDGSGMAVVEW